ncbi:hypothetical protein TNCT1_33380 [Streptomyces sp. 1-11]|nr:hypothetical protein TNCT1_33380 [Streptomyces sp. 1-11]
MPSAIWSVRLVRTVISPETFAGSLGGAAISPRPSLPCPLQAVAATMVAAASTTQLLRIPVTSRRVRIPTPGRERDRTGSRGPA